MSKSMVVLDSMEFERTEQECCVLKGWLYAEQDAGMQAEARLGEKPLTCYMRRVRRADVVKARSDLSFAGEDVGFEIKIPELVQYFGEKDSLKVNIYHELESMNELESMAVLEMSMEEVEEKYAQSTMQYHLEKVSVIEESVCVQGWCIDFCGGLEIKVFDQSGEITEKAVVSKGRRTDVSAAYNVEAEKSFGFSVSVPVQKLQGNEVILGFENRAAQRKETIDVTAFFKKNGSFLDRVKAFFVEKRQEIQQKQEWKLQKAEVFEYNVKFSIVVPLYHTPTVFLKKMIDSVVQQSYENWELCLADGSKDAGLETYIQNHYGKDARIRYQYLKENKGISGNTNAALAMAGGDFIVFADHDDTLSPDALYWAACELRNYPETEMIYTDEELVDKEGKRISPHYKPDFNLDYLRCVNYICHLLFVKRSLFEKVGFLRAEYDGAQDYDFVLRCVEQTENIRHIPRILYQWRSHESSTAGNQDSKTYAVEAGKKALEDHYKRMGIDAEVEFSGLFIVYRTIFKIKGTPKISILIPNKDHIDDLKKCVDSIRNKSTWKNYEIIIIENNSTEEETFRYYDAVQTFDEARLSEAQTLEMGKNDPDVYEADICELGISDSEASEPQIRVVYYEGEFNYSAINNFGATYASGEYLLLLNNDTEVITPNWIEAMLGICQREDTGVVGAKLYYPDDTIQHAGIVVGMGGFAGHIQTGYDRSYAGYLNRLKTIQDISAVTGACMMVKTDIYKALGGLDEGFAVALNDVDFCLRVRELGKLVVFQPQAELYHYESKSRGFETTPEKKSRFGKEIQKFRERYQALLEKGDPYYNPNLTLERGDCSEKSREEMAKGR